MSSFIEQAAERLEQLRRAGITLPEIHAPHPAPIPPPEVEAAVAANPVPAPRVAAPTALDFAPPAETRSDLSPQSRRVELDLNALAAAGLVTPNAPRSQMADQYRVIKRPLIANAIGRGAATVA